MGCDDEKLSKYLTHTFMAHCHTMICQQVTLSGEAEWPKVADAVIEAFNTSVSPSRRLTCMETQSGKRDESPGSNLHIHLLDIQFFFKVHVAVPHNSFSHY